jgi:hypothetical protein
VGVQAGYKLARSAGCSARAREREKPFVTTDDVEAQVSRAVAEKLDGGTRWLLRREIDKLPRLLPPGEDILHMAQGRLEGGTGLVVATSRRLMFVEQGVAHQRVEDLPYEVILSVQAEVNVVASKLMISGPSSEVSISRVYPKARTMEIAEYVRSRTATPGSGGHTLGTQPRQE